MSFIFSFFVVLGIKLRDAVPLSYIPSPPFKILRQSLTELPWHASKLAVLLLQSFHSAGIYKQCHLALPHPLPSLAWSMPVASFVLPTSPPFHPSLLPTSQPQGPVTPVTPGSFLTQQHLLATLYSREKPVLSAMSKALHELAPTTSPLTFPFIHSGHMASFLFLTPGPWH